MITITLLSHLATPGINTLRVSSSPSPRIFDGGGGLARERESGTERKRYITVVRSLKSDGSQSYTSSVHKNSAVMDKGSGTDAASDATSMSVIDRGVLLDISWFERGIGCPGSAQQQKTTMSLQCRK